MRWTGARSGEEARAATTFSAYGEQEKHGGGRKGIAHSRGRDRSRIKLARKKRGPAAAGDIAETVGAGHVGAVIQVRTTHKFPRNEADLLTRGVGQIKASKVGQIKLTNPHTAS